MYFENPQKMSRTHLKKENVNISDIENTLINIKNELLYQPIIVRSFFCSKEEVYTSLSYPKV